MRRGRMTFKCLSFLLGVLVILCIFGYGLLSTDVVNNKKDEMLWDVSFKDLSIVEGSVDAIVPAEVSRTGTEVNYIANLINAGDFYAFEVDIVNNGEFDAKVASIFKDSLDYNQQKYLDYDVLYMDGELVNINDIIKAGNKKRIVVTVRYKDGVKISDLSSEISSINLSFSINFEQAGY